LSRVSSGVFTSIDGSDGNTGIGSADDVRVLAQTGFLLFTRTAPMARGLHGHGMAEKAVVTASEGGHHPIASLRNWLTENGKRGELAREPVRLPTDGAIFRPDPERATLSRPNGPREAHRGDGRSGVPGEPRRRGVPPPGGVRGGRPAQEGL